MQHKQKVGVYQMSGSVKPSEDRFIVSSRPISGTDATDTRKTTYVVSGAEGHRVHVTDRQSLLSAIAAAMRDRKPAA